MKVAIYNIQSGEILRFFNGPSSAVDIQVGEGEEFYLNCPDTVTHIVDNTPTLLAAPAVAAPVKLLRIRQERNARLAKCDYTHISDAKLTADQKEAWKIYRQALRDFPATVDLNNIIWPVAPVEE